MRNRHPYRPAMAVLCGFLAWMAFAPELPAQKRRANTVRKTSSQKPRRPSVGTAMSKKTTATRSGPKRTIPPPGRFKLGERGKLSPPFNKSSGAGGGGGGARIRGWEKGWSAAQSNQDVQRRGWEEASPATSASPTAGAASTGPQTLRGRNGLVLLLGRRLRAARKVPLATLRCLMGATA
jgi:hypothetical protein